MADIAKPQVGKRGWNTLVDALFDRVNTHERNPLFTSLLAGVGDGTTDDTAVLNAQLAAAPAGSVMRGVPGKNYLISAPLVLRSGGQQTLDMTGCTITLAAGALSQMLRNAAYQGSGARDTNITVIGGTWNRQGNNGTGLNLHSLVFHRVDGLTVRGGRHLSTAGKYAILAGDVTRFVITDHHFVVAADGVHIQGPASDGIIRDITGTTGDDTVALTARDYPTYDLTATGGDISRVAIENVFPTNGLRSGVKILAGLSRTVSDVSVSTVRGSVGRYGVTLYSDTAQAETTGGTINGVSIRDVRVATPSAYSSVQISAATVGDVVIDGMSLPDATTKGLRVVASPTTVVDSLTLRNIQGLTPTGFSMIDITASATVNTLIVGGFVVNSQADKVAGRLVNVSGTVGNLVLAEGRFLNGEAIVYIGGAVPKVTVTAVEFTSQYGIRHTAANDCDATLIGVDATTVLGLLRLSGTAGASGVVRGSAMRTTVAAIIRSATQTARAVGAELRADIGILTPTAGDLVYNTDATEATGAGLSLYTGAAWKNLQV